MSFVLTCPNCGPREVTDFGFGGEIGARPSREPSFRELNAYNYFRANVAGRQREWWYHRSGCRAWFIAERDTRTNEVHFTRLPDDEDPAGEAMVPAGSGLAGARRERAAGTRGWDLR
ncbi:MAG: sarcosine oxidase subunit delta [Solirubrobacterales bacterium]|nr:sarcosine oxidase subunit delta [Solirubrobacterales bacterium]